MAQRGETVTYNDKTYTYVQSRITYNGNNVTYAGSKTLPTAGRVMSTDMTIEPLAQLEEITLTSNQTIAYSGDGDGWNKITVAVPSDIRNQSKEVNPSLSDNTITPDAGYSGLSSVKVNKLLVEGLDATKIVSGQTVSIGFTGSPSGITVVTGSYASDASATPGDLLYNKTAYTEDGKITGTIESKTSANVTANGPTVNIPIGYYPNGAQYTVDSAVPGPTSATVNDMGTVTFEVSLPAGYYTTQTVSGAYQLDQFNGTIVIPGQTPQVLATDGKFIIGDITVASVTPGIDPSDATASPSDILAGQTAYTADGKVTGTMAEVTPTFDGGVASGTISISTSGTNTSLTTTNSSGIAVVISLNEITSAITRASVLYNGAAEGHITKADNEVALNQLAVTIGTGNKANVQVNGTGTKYINNLTVPSG